MAGIINFIKKILGNSDTTSRRSYSPRIRLSTNSYLLEFRYSGYPKKYILDRYFELKRAYRITHPQHHYVPHITIAGPIVTNHERELTKEIQRIIFRNAHHFHEPGNLIQTGKFIRFETDIGGSVLAIKINPPQSLLNLKREIESTINTKTDFKCQVYRKDIWHTTLWNMKKNRFTSEKQFSKVWHNLENAPQEMKFILDRLTLIKNGRILEEYDLIDKTTLSRLESLNNSKRYSSYLKMKAKLESLGESFKF